MEDRVSSKHARHQPLAYGFLNNLHDWEASLKENDKNLKAQLPGKEKQGMNIVGNGEAFGKTSSVDRSSARHYDRLRNYDEFTKSSGNYMMHGSSVDANSEKELGNEYFKKKKFNDAIDCYSRSIALSPTAVAYANRAMAYIKITRYQEAEDDCTEALNLDDRYIKAYSRRSTARKELGKLKSSVEDAEFALKLEPQNQEIKKQYTEAKSLYEKNILEKVSGALRNTMQGAQKETKVNMEKSEQSQRIQSFTVASQRMGISDAKDLVKDNNGQVSLETSMKIESSSMKTERKHVNTSHNNTIQNSGLGSSERSQMSSKQELKTSVQELAARASALAMTEAAKNITVPNSAYQFEISWRGLSGEPASQTRLLKATSPTSLSKIFKNALSAILLMEIIKCIATFFTEETELAVKYLENLSKIPRFDMIVMCLSSMDKADLLKIWDDLFSTKGTLQYADVLGKLRSKYLPKQ